MANFFLFKQYLKLDICSKSIKLLIARANGKSVACCVIKIQNKLKYNFSKVELWRVIFPGIFHMGVENWFEFAGVSNNRGSRNRE